MDSYRVGELGVGEPLPGRPLHAGRGEAPRQAGGGRRVRGARRRGPATARDAGGGRADELGIGWVGNDRLPPEEFAEKLEWARERIARDRGARSAAASCAPRPTRAPDRAAAPTRRSAGASGEPHRGAAAGGGPARGSAARAGRGRHREDHGAGGALRAGPWWTTACPWRAMLAITFTDKAAAEMRERVRAASSSSGGARTRARRRAPRSPRSTASADGCSRTHALSAGHRPRLPRAGRAGGRAAWRWTPSTGRSRTSWARRRHGAAGGARPAGAGGVLHARRAARHGAHRLLAPAQPRRALPQPRAGRARRGRRARRAAGGRRPRGAGRARPRRGAGGREGERDARALPARSSSGCAGARLAAPDAAQGAGAEEGERQGPLHRRLRRVPRGASTPTATSASTPSRRATTPFCACCSSSTAAATSEAKRARSALDFEDLELLARDLLAGDEGLREQYASRYTHVMVDEFQDVNPLQSELIGLVARDNLFRVGRREPVDLRLPPRGRERVPRPPRGRGRARAGR